jgi:hypothetical protein
LLLLGVATMSISTVFSDMLSVVVDVVEGSVM